MRSLIKLILVFFVSISSFATTEFTRFVEYSDLVKYKKAPYGVDFTTKVQTKLKGKVSSKIGKFDSLRFEEFPKASSVEANIYYTSGEGKGSFVKVQISLNGNNVDDVEVLKVTSLRDTKFKVRVGLAQLKAIIEDVDNGITILYPIGSSAFDFGKSTRSNKTTILMTPKMNGHISRSKTYRARKDPAYYKGKPFLRFVDKRLPLQLWGFHISPWTDFLERGFVSAGCLRLDEKHLWRLFEIVRYGSVENIPLTVDYYIEDQDKHPMPSIDNEYEKIVASRKKCTGRWRKKYCRDVFRTERVKGRPPVEELNDFGKGNWPKK